MRLITWNCQGTFRKKVDIILEYKPDILVIQECEQIEKLNLSSAKLKPNCCYWYGDNIHKGIGVFSYSDYQIELLPEFNPEFRYILPFRLTNDKQEFTFLAIWAMDNKKNHEARYIGQIWLAINYYTALLGDSTFLIGDFNSNKIWDYKDRVGNHTNVVNKLAEKNIYSVYHKYFNLEQGKENHPTLFLQRKKHKPYHIDYCFVSKDLLDKVENIEIGKYENWIEYSDHSPMIIEINL